MKGRRANRLSLPYHERERQQRGRILSHEGLPPVKTKGLQFEAVILSVLPRRIYILQDHYGVFIDLRSVIEAMGLSWLAWTRFFSRFAEAWDTAEDKPIVRPSMQGDPCFDHRRDETLLLEVKYFLAWLEEIRRPLYEISQIAHDMSRALRWLPPAEWQRDSREPSGPDDLRRDQCRLRDGPAVGQAGCHHVILAAGAGRRGSA